MICPSCPAQPLALFICEDGVHRCYSCKARRPVVPPMAKPMPTFKSTPGPAQGAKYDSPYTSQSGKRRAAASRADALIAIEIALKAKMRDIEAAPNWRRSEASVGHFAYAQAIQIVRDQRREE